MKKLVFEVRDRFNGHKLGILLLYLLGIVVLIFSIRAYWDAVAVFDADQRALLHVFCPVGVSECIPDGITREHKENITTSLIWCFINIPYLIAWMITLADLLNIRKRIWFILTLLMGPLFIPLYVLAGPIYLSRADKSDG